VHDTALHLLMALGTVTHVDTIAVAISRQRGGGDEAKAGGGGGGVAGVEEAKGAMGARHTEIDPDALVLSDRVGGGSFGEVTDILVGSRHRGGCLRKVWLGQAIWVVSRSGGS
jgi:hypothetical protein